MNLKAFFQKNLIHIGALVFMILFVVIYFKPELEGYGVKQHDMEQWQGSAQEIAKFRENTGGQEPLWTNSMFGGMPAEQITILYSGNIFKTITHYYFTYIPNPIGSILLHLLCFYIFARLLRINPIVSVLGAIAFSFSSYELIIIQAGHITKSMTMAFLPALLGAFIYAYRTNRLWGILLAAIFMAFDLAQNHLQVTYYFVFVLLFVGLYFLYEAVVNKKLKDFALTSGGLIAGFLVAFAINSGNILLTADYAKNTIRGGNDVTVAPDGLPAKNQSAGLDRDYITTWSYGVGESFTFVSPYVKGGGSVPLGDSPFREQIENSDLSTQDMEAVLGNYSYWGDQPSTTGPVYLGVVVVMLAFLGLIFLKDRIKWALFAVTILAVMLSWGKNFMGLTNFFIDHVPGYNKFRAVTIILMVIELTIPILGVLFLNQLLKEHERMREKKKQLLIAIGSFFVFLLIVKIVGLGDGYSSVGERQQMAQITTNIEKQIRQLDPNVAKTQYNLDITNPQQVSAFAATQSEQYYKNYENVKDARKAIFHSSMNRSLLFTFLAGLLFVFFVFSTMAYAPTILASGLLLLTMFDLIPVSYQYLGNQETDFGYKFWEDAGLSANPIAANEADEQILMAEVAQNPALAAKIEKASREGAMKADELGYTGQARTNYINSCRFSVLNFATNYRIFDLNGGFSSSRASYYHKSLGGYHGAKLRNINNLFDFHLAKMNNKVYDMMNVKYFMQQNEDGTSSARPNPTALGPAWLVKRVEQYNTPNDEIRALGSQFKLTNSGPGTLLVNKMPEKEAVIYGGEKLQYLVPGRKDTLTVPLSNGIPEGTEAMMVMDVKGKTDLVPMMTMSLDTAKSFTSLVKLKVMNEFKPQEEVVMLASEAKQLSARQFSGDGTIRMVSYQPNRIVYDANVNGKQLAVFSEVYYPNGWKAFVDGKEMPIRKVNYLLRGVELAGGKHKIELVYDLPKFHSANTIALISSLLLLLLLAVATVYEVRKRRAGKTTETPTEK